MRLVADENAQDAPSPVPAPAEQETAENTRKPRRRRRKKSKSARRTPFDPQQDLDPLARRILQIEMANGPGSISARQIKEIGNLPQDIDTINRRRSLGAYQRAIEELQKDAIQLIVEGQTKAIRKLLAQIDHADPKVSQRASLFFAEASMTAHLEKAKAALALEMQNRDHKLVKKTIVEFVMDDAIQVLGEPHVAAAGAPVASLPPPDATGSAPQAEPARPPEPASPVPQPPPAGGGGLTPPTAGESSALTPTIPQENAKNSASDLEKPVTLEIGSQSASPGNQGQPITYEVPNNTSRIGDEKVKNPPVELELEDGDDGLIGGIGD